MARKGGSDEQYAELGKALEKVLVKDHIEVIRNWRRFVAISFTRGLFVGFGSVIGASLLIALLLWILSQLGELPFVGRIFDNIVKQLDSR